MAQRSNQEREYQKKKRRILRHSRNASLSQKINSNQIKHTMETKMEISPFEFSKVDIIVPFHGQYQKVTRLIESVYRVTRRPFLLTLVDDGSKNSNYIENIKENTNINCIRNETQQGFGASLLKGYENTEFPWVVFMNSDCYVDNINWLNIIGESMFLLKDEGVKMVSARFPNSGSDIREISNPARAIMDPEERDIILKEGNYLPLVCTMCHRELFPRIGGFIKSYPFGWYEDQELAYRMNHYGFKQAICARSWIHHDGMATIRELWNEAPEIKGLMEKNEELCIKDINLMQK